MGFHGFRADLQSGGNLLVGPALCQELDDLALAGGEATARGLFGRARRCAFQVAFEHHLLDLGGKERFAPAESVDGGDQVPPCVRFQHEPASAGFERLAD